jgi:hypothetical protein
LGLCWDYWHAKLRLFDFEDLPPLYRPAALEGREPNPPLAIASRDDVEAESIKVMAEMNLVEPGRVG